MEINSDSLDVSLVSPAIFHVRFRANAKTGGHNRGRAGAAELVGTGHDHGFDGWLLNLAPPKLAPSRSRL